MFKYFLTLLSFVSFSHAETYEERKKRLDDEKRERLEYEIEQRLNNTDEEIKRLLAGEGPSKQAQNPEPEANKK